MYLDADIERQPTQEQHAPRQGENAPTMEDAARELAFVVKALGAIHPKRRRGGSYPPRG